MNQTEIFVLTHVSVTAVSQKDMLRSGAAYNHTFVTYYCYFFFNRHFGTNSRIISN